MRDPMKVTVSELTEMFKSLKFLATLLDENIGSFPHLEQLSIVDSRSYKEYIEANIEDIHNEIREFKAVAHNLFLHSAEIEKQLVLYKH